MFNIQTPREFLVKDCERVIIVLRVPVRVELALLNILHNLTSAHAVHADIISSALTGCNTQAASQSEACIQHAERDVTKRCVQEHLSPLRDVYSYLHYLPHSYSLIHCVDIFYLPLDYLTCILFHLKNIYIYLKAKT